MLHALHIGLDYRRTPYELAQCARDARALGKLFRPRDRQTGGGRVVTGKRSKRALLGDIRQLVAALGPSDWGVLTFSGHGTQVPDLPYEPGGPPTQQLDEGDGWDEAFCTHEPDGSLDVITDDELRAAISRRAKGARLLIVADACHSGTMQRSLRLKGQRGELAGGGLPAVLCRRWVPTSAVRRRGKLRPLTQSARAGNAAPQRALPNVVLVSGCTDTEFSYEAEKHGVLTGALLAAHEPGLTVGEWFTRARDEVAASEFGALQHPQFHGSKAAQKWVLP